MGDHRVWTHRARVTIGVLLAAGVVVGMTTQADASSLRFQLDPGDSLGPGDEIVSPSGLYRLEMLEDGRLVEYGPGEEQLFSMPSGNEGSILVMQRDGNLVLRAPGNISTWSSETDGNPGTVLQIQDDSGVMLYAPGHKFLKEILSPDTNNSVPTPRLELGQREKELLKLRSTIEKAAADFGVDPVLLAAIIHHEGGNYLDPLRRSPTAVAEEALAKTRGASVGIAQIQTGTARMVLREKFGRTDLSDNEIIDHLIYDRDFSIFVAAGYVDWMTTRTVGGRNCGATDRRELFLQYAVDDKLACTLRDYNYDVKRLSEDSSVALYTGVDPPAPASECAALRRREGYFTESKRQAELVMAH
jgi:hypothetical protein